MSGTRRVAVGRAWGVALGVLLASPVLAQNVDPLASNNGLYPTYDQWSGTLRVSNLDYPEAPVAPGWTGGPQGNQPLTVATAPAYAAALKTFLEPSLRGMIETPDLWNPRDNGCWDMTWSGQGQHRADGSIDPTSGREAILGSYTGQILPRDTWTGADQPTVDVQNHGVVCYNDVAASMLGQLWADPYNPDVSAVTFPEGSIVVKVEAVSADETQWGILQGAAVWHVFRPSVAAQEAGDTTPGVIPLRVLQMGVAVKDSVASPQTGWVYLAYIYGRDADGQRPWDRMVPLGAQWGNDPNFSTTQDGSDPSGGPLQESWINPDAPAFALQTLGWGGRLAGPMDVSARRQVRTPSGGYYGDDDPLHATSCLSCHGSAEAPFLHSLYPSPNRAFPPDGQPLFLYDPGSPDWARWFQNRAGNEGMAGSRVGLEYDMMITFALADFDRAMGRNLFTQTLLDGH